MCTNHAIITTRAMTYSPVTGQMHLGSLLLNEAEDACLDKLTLLVHGVSVHYRLQRARMNATQQPALQRQAKIG